jgi:hypothetical protein
MVGVYETTTGPEFANQIPCGTTLLTAPEALACALMDDLRARNIGAMEAYMSDPFKLGYWGSEGITGPPAQILQELDKARLPADTSGLTFTHLQDEFPPLAGTQVYDLLGPGNYPLILYSEGWGPDGQGAALLYLALDASGNLSWSGMIYSDQHFDK